MVDKHTKHTNSDTLTVDRHTHSDSEKSEHTNSNTLMLDKDVKHTNSDISTLGRDTHSDIKHTKHTNSDTLTHTQRYTPTKHTSPLPPPTSSPSPTPSQHKPISHQPTTHSTDNYTGHHRDLSRGLQHKHTQLRQPTGNNKIHTDKQTK